MFQEKWEEKMGDFKRALDRLSEGLKEDNTNSLVVDGVIKRFEFTYELSWKVLKRFLEYHGLEEAKSPRSTFKEAYAFGLIENGEEWIDMLNDRNLTSHTYDEETAKQIYNKIKSQHYHNLLKLYEKLRSEKIS